MRPFYSSASQRAGLTPGRYPRPDVGLVRGLVTWGAHKTVSRAQM